MFGTDGSHYVTKVSFLTLLFSCLNVDFLPVNFISDTDFFYQITWVTSSQQACFKI